MASNTLSDLSILMVVPSQLQGHLLKRSLHQSNLNISACTNMEQALADMQNYQPDLVISSMYFNDGDGADLVQAMRANAQLENILFMLISSEERFEALDPIRQAGVIAVLPKPFHVDDIQQALDKTRIFLSADAKVKEHVAIKDMKALVVDDSRLARRHLIKLLIKNGLQEDNIHQAEDGKLGSQVLQEQDFDVLLTDYNMPVMDGEGLLVFVREQEKTQQLPVIMITSEKHEGKLQSIQNHGVTAVLDKPFDPLHLFELLETCV